MPHGRSRAHYRKIGKPRFVFSIEMAPRLRPRFVRIAAAGLHAHVRMGFVRPSVRGMCSQKEVPECSTFHAVLALDRFFERYLARLPISSRRQPGGPQPGGDQPDLLQLHTGGDGEGRRRPLKAQHLHAREFGE